MLTWEDIHDLKQIHYGKSRAIYLGRFENTGTSSIDDLPCTDPTDHLIRLHSRYLSYTRSRRIVLQRADTPAQVGPDAEGMDTTACPEYRAKPYVVRGTEEYRRRQMARCHGIISQWQKLGLPKGTTIRVSTRQEGSIWTHFQTMKRDWPAFMNWFRGKYGCVYIWACEPTKRGYIHYHIVTPKKLSKGSTAQAVLKWWRSRGKDITDAGVEVQAVRGEAVGYIMKYVTKHCKDDRWNAMLWLSGKRMLGVSRALNGLAQAPLGPEQTNSQSWTLLGIVPEALIEWILQDRPPPDDIREVMREISPSALHRDGLGRRAKHYIS